MIKVKNWMSTQLITVEEDAGIIEAMHLLKEQKIRRLPVMRKGRLAGVITEKMISEYLPSKATTLDTWELHYLLSKTAVKEAMNPHPLTVTPETELSVAVQLIHDNKLNGILIVNDQDDPVGMLTTTNIAEALVALCTYYKDTHPL